MVVTDVLAMMDEESNKASQKSTGFIPVFLTLKDKQKALIRPLFNLNHCVVLAMHRKFNKSNPQDSVNAVCGKEVGNECLYCEAVANDKKLAAGISFMLPVWVYAIKQLGENGQWIDVTYKNAEDKDIVVSGLRILELKAFGTINDVLQFLRSYYAEDEHHDITRCDFIIERKGADQTTTYVTLPKVAKPMSEHIKTEIPTAEDVKHLVLVACPPSGQPLQGASPSKAGEADESTPEF